MNEQESIQRAYAETVETIFKVFFGEFTSAHGDPEAEQGAKERFCKGIVHGWEYPFLHLHHLHARLSCAPPCFPARLPA